MATFYDLLEKRATSKEDSKKNVYTHSCYQFSYKYLYDRVNQFIKDYILSNKNMKPGQKVNLIVDNSVDSIAMIIALLKCHLMPAIFDYKILINESSEFYKDFINFPIINKRLEDLSSATKEELEAEKKRREGIKVDYFARIESIFDNSPYFPYDPEKSQFLICTSGSEGSTPHLCLLDEEKLISNRNQYGEVGSTFLSHISCAHISGILTNLVDPLKNGTTVILNEDFDINLLSKDPVKKLEKKTKKQGEYYISYRNPALLNAFPRIFIFPQNAKIDESKLIHEPFIYTRNMFKEFLVKEQIFPDSVMLPRDILLYLADYEQCDIDFSNLKHIYLAGGKNNYEVISELRKRFPSIKPNVFENLYGSTESTVISRCKEEQLKTCYIDISNYHGDLKDIIYTYDRKKYFRVGGIPVVDGEETQINGFNLIPYLPVSEENFDGVIEGPNLTLYNKTSADSVEELNDLGLYIDGKLYILGRKTELSTPEGISNRNLLNTEEYMRRALDADVYCLFNGDDPRIQIFVGINDLNIEKILDNYRKCLFIKDRLEEVQPMLYMNAPIFLHEDAFPRSKVSGKISKVILKDFKRYARIQYENFKNYPASVVEYGSMVISKLFDGYECSEVNNDGLFTLKLNGALFYPLTLGLNKILEVVSSDDGVGEITFRLKPNIIFLTDEEIAKIKTEIAHEISAANVEVADKIVYHSPEEKRELYEEFFLRVMAEIKKDAKKL